MQTPVLKPFFCECVLSLIPNKEKAILEFKRVLTKGGKLIISDLYQRGKGLEQMQVTDHAQVRLFI